MLTTIDSGGRVVIPKAVRAELGLVAGSEVDITFDGVAIRIDRVPEPEPELIEVDGLLVVAATGAPITDDHVRALRDSAYR